MATNLPPSDIPRSGAIVLVHGSWVGEWSWLPVLGQLQASGRAVYPVSLTGHGARRHQSGPTVTLADHVLDVCGVIETMDLTDVTLVGHSYGGRVITKATERVAERLRSLVFVDAHAPVAKDPGHSAERVALAEENGGMLPFIGHDPDPELLGGQEAVDWFLARTEMQSFACLTAPWEAELPSSLAKTYIFASASANSRFTQYADAIRDDDDWSYHELPGPHFLMMSHPQELAEIILRA